MYRLLGIVLFGVLMGVPTDLVQAQLFGRLGCRGSICAPRCQTCCTQPIQTCPQAAACCSTNCANPCPCPCCKPYPKSIDDCYAICEKCPTANSEQRCRCYCQYLYNQPSECTIPVTLPPICYLLNEGDTSRRCCGRRGLFNRRRCGCRCCGR